MMAHQSAVMAQIKPAREGRNRRDESMASRPASPKGLRCRF